jgi:hypothetical protein
MSPEMDHSETRSPVFSVTPDPEPVVSRPVFELKIKGAATFKAGAGQYQSTPLPSPVVEDSKAQSARSRRDDEDVPALMRRIRQILVQRDGIRSAEKRIAEEGAVTAVSVVDEPKGTAANAELSKKGAREKLLARLQAEKALIQLAPRANTELEETEKRLKAQAKLRIKLAREKSVAVASGSLATAMNGAGGGGLSTKGAASAVAMEQNLRAKLLSRRSGAAD